MKKLTIKFSYNYKKLKDRMFTTIRRYTPQKYVYYSSNVGKVFDVLVNDKKQFQAKLIQVFSTHFNSLTKEFIEYDTDGIYKLQKTELIILIFLRVKG